MSDFTVECSSNVGKTLYEWKEHNTDYNKTNLNGLELFILGKLYEKKEHIPEAIKYYKMAVEKDDNSRAGQAMNNLAYLYQYRERNITEAIKYYKKAIGKGNTNAINNLALLYEMEKKDITKAIEYYKISIEKDNNKAMNNLGVLYHNVKNNMEAIKYYKMAIEKGNINAMYNLAILYKEEDNITEAIKYYEMVIEKGYIIFNGTVKVEQVIDNLVKLYKKGNSEYLKKLIYEMNKLKDKNGQLKKKNERLKTKLKYMPPSSGGVGYYEAKEDFDKLCGK